MPRRASKIGKTRRSSTPEPPTRRSKRSKTITQYKEPESDSDSSQSSSNSEASDHDMSDPPKLARGTGKRAAPETVQSSKKRMGRPAPPVNYSSPPPVQTPKLSVNLDAPEHENPLYQALSDPETAIQELAIEWVESYQDSHEDAIASFLNLFLRSCGCIHLLLPHDVLNYDSASATVDDVQTMFELQKTHQYPFTSNNKQLRFFRKNVLDFVDEIVSISHSKGLLYDEPTKSQSELMKNMLAWIISFTNSTARPLRFVFTVCALAVQLKLAKTMASISLNMVRRQRHIAVRRATKSVQLEVQNYPAQQEILKEYFTEIMESVFVHRYRDVAPQLRLECVKYLGEWMSSYEDFFLQAENIRYLGWLLSDPNALVRLEIAKVLHNLYKSSDAGNMNSALRQFTERFKGQLVSMSSNDVDLSVRYALLGCINEIAKIGVFNEASIVEITLNYFRITNPTHKSIDRFRIEYAKLIVSEVEQISSLSRQKYQVQDDKLNLDIYIMIKSLIDFVANAINVAEKSKCTINSQALTELFVSIYQLNTPISWEDLVKYMLLDFSSILDDGSKKSEDLKKFLVVNDQEKNILLNFILGSLYTIFMVKKKPQKEPNTAEEESVEPVLMKLTSTIPSLQKELIKNPQQFAVYLRILSVLLIRTEASGNIHASFDNLNQSDKFEELTEQIFNSYRIYVPQIGEQVEGFGELTEAYDTFFRALFDNNTSQHNLHFSTVSSSIRLQILDILQELLTEAKMIVRTEELLKSDLENIVDLTTKLAVPLLKISRLGNYINLNDFIKKSTIVDDYLNSECLEDISFKTLVNDTPQKFLLSLDVFNSSFEVILDFALLTYSWKLEELIYFPAQSSSKLDVISSLGGLKSIVNKLLSLLDTTFVPFDFEIDSHIWAVLNKIQTIISSKVIDLIFAVRLLFEKYRDGDRGKLVNFDEFFKDEGSFFVLLLSPKVEKQLLEVFLYKEARLGKILNVKLNKGSTEDVNIEHMVENTIDCAVDSVDLSKFDDENDEEVQVEKSKGLPEQNVTDEKTWESEKDLCVYVLKLVGLSKLGLTETSFKERIELNQSKLGSMYSKLIRGME